LKTGLFSAAVASLISVSIQDIRPSSQDTSNFYLENIFQAIADPNRPNISLPLSPPTFSPPNYAIWVNSLWFMSLVISLTCALLATLLQQWARRYLKVTQTRYNPHKRARIRAFFFEGVGKFLLPCAVEALPALLHISLFLFFSGLVVFLYNIDLTVFKLVLSWVGICTAIYGCITFVSIFYPNSPYYTPLTSLVWYTLIGVSFITFRILRWFTQSVYSHLDAYLRFRSLEVNYRNVFLQGMQKRAETTAMKLPPDIDTRSFMWTFDCLDEDHELEHFFAGLPGFRTSNVVKDPFPSLAQDETHRIFTALIGLLDRTFSSDLLPQPDKHRRAMICSKAVDPAEVPYAYWWILDRVVFEDPYGPLQSPELVHVVRGWDDGKDEETPLFKQAVISSVVARAQRRDDLWFAIASDEMGIPESVLRDYATHGDSLSLAILIHITHQQFIRVGEHADRWRLIWDFSNVLEAASKFNVQDTSPELQHEFCELWNQVVLRAQRENNRGMAILILGRIRHVYMALHQDTDSAPTQFSASTGDQDHILKSPSSYPVCKVSDHIHDDSVSTDFPCSVKYDSAALVLPSLTRADTPSSFVSASGHAVESHTTLLSQNTNYTTIGTPGIPFTSPDPATSRITTSHPTSKTSTIASPLSSSPAPATASLRNNADPLIPPHTLIAPLSASATPAFENILHTGSLLSSLLPVTRSDLSHRSIIGTTFTSASPGTTSVPELGATAKDEGPSSRGPNAEHTGDHPLDPSQFQYDIV
jgi:hypothetical protein